MIVEPKAHSASRSMSDESSVEQTASETSLICSFDWDVNLTGSESPNSLNQFVQQLGRFSAEKEVSQLWFHPVPYGESSIQVHSQFSQVEQFSLPCPYLPIPQSSDFSGVHANKVEASFHVPILDAYRVFQLNEKLKEHVRENSIALAVSPGPLGFHFRSVALRRRRKDNSLLIGALHWQGWKDHAIQQLNQILLNNSHTSKIDLLLWLSQDDVIQFLLPGVRDRSSLKQRISSLSQQLNSVQTNWGTGHSHEGKIDRWIGKSFLWLASRFSRYADKRLKGSVAAARSLKEVRLLLEELLGLQLDEFPNQGNGWSEAVAHSITDMVSLSIDQYLRWFYSDCDFVIDCDKSGSLGSLEHLNVSAERSFRFSQGDTISRLIQDIRGSAKERRALANKPSKKVRLSDFQWTDASTAVGHVAISDVHLGDGKSAERAIALQALTGQMERLKISRFEIVGDLIQRDVPAEKTQRHRSAFLKALRSLTHTIHDEEPNSEVIEVKMNSDCELQRAEMFEKLSRFAIKNNLTFKLDGQIHNSGNPTGPVHIEQGNHDEGEDLSKVIPGANVAESMIRMDPNSGVLFCHGHIWNLPEVPNAIQNAGSFDELSHQLSDFNLKDSLETSQIIYSITSGIWRACAKRVDVRSIWKNDLQPALSRFVNWQKSRCLGDEARSEFSNFLNGVISPVDNAEVAARCGVRVRELGQTCWAVCEGHSHRASIDFVKTIRQSDQQQGGTLLVNCGKFHGKNMTIAFLRYPEAAIFQWDPKKRDFFLLYHHILTAEEIRLLDGMQALPSRGLNSIEPKRSTSSRNVLLEICSEGEGHSARQKSLTPLYKEFGKVRVAASGIRRIEWAEEQWPGHTLERDENGVIQSVATALAFSPNHWQIQRAAVEIAKQIPDYELLITDFGPLLPLAKRIARDSIKTALPPLLHISHHAALQSQYSNTPRPTCMDAVTYWATQRYIDSVKGDVDIGFHFEKYHKEILTPPIRQELLSVESKFDSNDILVYLSGKLPMLVGLCNQLDPCKKFNWHIFERSKVRGRTQRCEKNIWSHIIGDCYLKILPSSRGAIVNAGFMGPAELLHLGKPFACVPITGHGEQMFNAAALSKISDVAVVDDLQSASCLGQLQSMLDVARDTTAPLQRTGLMGPILPYQDQAPWIREIIKQQLCEKDCTRLLTKSTMRAIG